MNLIYNLKNEPRNKIEKQLFRLATAFLGIYSIILTLSNAVRVHSWQAEYQWKHWIGFAAWVAGYWLIYREVNRRLPEHDPFLLPIVSLLSGWGLLSIWRLDSTLGMRQTLWLVLGILVIYLAIRVPDLLHSLRRYKYIWLFSGLLLIVLTFFFGDYPGGVGPRLWLGCCGIYFQPSEPLKLLFIAYLAAYLADRLPIKLSVTHLLAPTLIVVSAASILLIAQRDLGTASLLIVLYTLIIFLGSGKRRILVIASIVTLAFAAIGYLVFDVIRLRVDAWLNPWVDPSGESYQIVQSLLSIASGRLFGTGPGLGSPTLVPVSHSDFIATAISEETGVIGLGGLILIYCLLLFRGLSLAIRSSNSYRRILAGGISVYFATQAIFILGGNLRLLPLTGVTLPFVSYGGSSLLTSIFSAAILLIISSQKNEKERFAINPRPYLITAGLTLSGFIALILLAGWWGVIRSENLQFRPENLRWTINERYVPRGSLLDRNNQPISISTGKSGVFQRTLLYPSLGTTIGYNHPIFGKSGLEANLDGYLTGLQGNPNSLIWLNEWIYSQLPPGLNVRLSIDLEIQNTADELLQQQVGALVLLNASTGEILTISSHPSFDPNMIDQKYEEWKQDSDAPLINRATQGTYPIGAVIGPFIYSIAEASDTLPQFSSQLTLTIDDEQLICARVPDSPLSWETAISAGCPGTVNEIAIHLGKDQVGDLFRSLGFYESPVFQLPVAPAVIDDPIESVTSIIFQNNEFLVSPLQMAIAASTITRQGYRPSPQLALAVNTPNQGWVVLPSTKPEKVLSNLSLDEAITLLAGSDSPFWQTIASAGVSGGNVTWFVGGTVPQWQGLPLSIALVIEEDNPDLAQFIGRTILNSALTPLK